MEDPYGEVDDEVIIEICSKRNLALPEDLREEEEEPEGNGDCGNCPPHYGYRYGCWYYGKGHVHGCEFGGNKGDGGL